jgi:hypothetical protein
MGQENDAPQPEARKLSVRRRSAPSHVAVCRGVLLLFVGHRVRARPWMSGGPAVTDRE